MADRLLAPKTLVLPAVLSLGAYVGLVILDRLTGTLRADTTPATLAVLAVAAVGYVLAVIAVERTTPEATPTDLTVRSALGSAVGLLWAAPIVFRLLLVLTEPTLSDDVYRYLWDGHVLSNGVNPYSYAISAAELDRLEIPVRELANNRNLSSPYLPTLQLLFAALAVVAPSEPVIIQLVMAGFDVAAAAMIWKLLAVCGLPTNRVLLYLWHPLVIVESAHGAHFDSLMTFLALAAAVAAFSPTASTSSSRSTPTGASAPRRRSVSPVLLALGVLTRPIPALLAPVLWWRWRWSQRVLFGVVLLAMVVPFGFGASGWGLFGEPTGAGVFGSARVYSTEFRFNAVVATWIEQLLPSVEAFTAVTGGLMVVILAGVFWLARPTGTDSKSLSESLEEPAEVRRLLRLMVIPVAAYVVLTPVFHPWYLVVLIALGTFVAPGTNEPLHRWWFVGPIGYLAFAAPLSYLTYRDPENFRELDWVRRVEWWPTLVLAAVAVYVFVRFRTSDRPRGAQRPTPRR